MVNKESIFSNKNNGLGKIVDMNRIGTGPARRAISYVRFSHPAQTLGDSLRRQVEEAQKYAEANGLELDLQVVDQAMSAYTGSHRKKGGLKDLLEMIEAGKIARNTVLLVEHLDRLSREDPMTAMSQFNTIITAGIEVVTLLGGRPQVYNQETLKQQPGRLFEIVGMMMRANEESEAKSRRLSASWEKKRTDAGRGVPMTSECPAWLKRAGDKFEIIPGRDAVVRRIFDLALKGTGKMGIACRLNEEGVEPFTARARGWHPSYVTKILMNPAVIGKFAPGRRENGRRVLVGTMIDDYYPRIISDETWWTLWGLRRERTGGRRGRTFANLFSGILRCSECHGRVCLEDKGRKKPGHGDSRYLVCDEARRKKGCSNRKRWRYLDVERSLLLQLTIALPNQTEVANRLTADITRREAEAVAYRQQAKRLALAYAQDEQRSPSAIEVIAHLDGQASELEESVRQMTAQLDEARNMPFIERQFELKGTFNMLDTMAGQALYDKRAALNLRMRANIEEIVLSPAGTWTALVREGQGLKSYGGPIQTVEEAVGELSMMVEGIKTLIPTARARVRRKAASAPDAA
jgi:DNA invertase Pin-like site-specific DNA recombinase